MCCIIRATVESIAIVREKLESNRHSNLMIADDLISKRSFLYYLAKRSCENKIAITVYAQRGVQSLVFDMDSSHIRPRLHVIDSLQTLL